MDVGIHRVENLAAQETRIVAQVIERRTYLHHGKADIQTAATERPLPLGAGAAGLILNHNA